MHQKRDPAQYEKQKAKQELKDCTFKPQIDKKSAKMAQDAHNLTPSYEVLHKKQAKQKERAKKLLREKEAKELKECTFTPTIYSKKKSMNILPGTENKI